MVFNIIVDDIKNLIWLIRSQVPHDVDGTSILPTVLFQGKRGFSE